MTLIGKKEVEWLPVVTKICFRKWDRRHSLDRINILSRARVLKLLVRVVGHSADMRALVRIARKGILPSALRPPNGGLLFLRRGRKLTAAPRRHYHRA